MPRYEVTVTYARTVLVEVEADDEDEARSVAPSEGTYYGREFGPEEVDVLDVTPLADEDEDAE